MLSHQKEFLLLSKLTANVKGWLTEREAWQLYQLAQNVRPDYSIVEIGSFEGKSTTALLLGAETGNNPVVWAIDTFEDTGTPSFEKVGCKTPEDETNLQSKRHKTFWDNINDRGLHKNLRVIVNYSYNVASNFEYEDKIGLIFIDGSHEYEDVERDISDWYPHMAPRGIMVFHDYNAKGFPGVVKAVDEFKHNFGKYHTLDGNMFIGVLKE